MPEISLNEYFAKLDHALSEHAADEVIHHSRHILQYYPKNAMAYSLMGRALVMNGRWEEGRAALRRVLGVYPDDYAAHLGLSEANERLNHPDEAIWHLERAFEQHPNDKELIDALRSLYHRYRKIDNAKIQLTSASVARQYLQSGAYTQAIDTLRGALKRMNDRLDLKLLLAQILWQEGSQEESAEIALEVLKVLPDCLEANRIMAMLWLTVGRPSDAQRYVNRLESLAPYLAVELVQGYAPDEDVFRLDELDYRRSAQSELTSERPDWLQEVSSAAPPVEDAKAQQEPEKDDWAHWTSAILGGQNAEPERSADQPTSARFASMMERDNGQRSDTPGFTGVFGPAGEGSTGELDSLFGDHADDEDPMAWLREAGVHLVDDGNEDPDFENLLNQHANELAAPEAEAEENPMAWLADTDADLLREDNTPEQIDLRDDDPFAWMRGSVAEPTSEVVEQSADALDWPEDDALLHEVLGMEALNTPSGDQEPPQEQPWEPPAFEPEPPPSGREPAPPQPPAEEGVPGPRRGLTAMLQEASFDWLNKQDDPVSSDDMDAWRGQFSQDEPQKPVTSEPDWLNQLADQQPADFSAPQAEPEPSDEAWLAEFALDAEATVVSPDWLGALEPKSEAADEDEFAWMTDEALSQAQQEVNVGDGELSNWLSDLEPASDPTPAATPEPIGAEAPEWLSSLEPEPEASQPEAEPAADDEFAWLTNEVVNAQPEAVASETPEWLSSLEPETNEPEAAPAGDAEFAWMADEALTAQPEAEAVAGETPEWLSELEPKQETSAPKVEPVGEDEFAWLTADALSEAETAAEEPAELIGWMAEWSDEEEADTPETVEDVAGLLSELEAEVAADQALPAEEFGWLSQPSAEEPAAAVPDWLAELEPEPPAAEPEAEPVGEADLGWPSEETPAGEEEAAVFAVPDWLAELEPEPPAEPETEQVGESEQAWSTEETPAEEEAAVPAVPEWLAELEPEPPAAEEMMPETEINWPEEALAAANGSGGSVGDDTVRFDVYDEEDAQEPEPAPANGEEPLEPTPAHNAPDWLNAMVPGLDVDYEAADEEAEEEEPVESSQREYAWLLEMVDEEMAATEGPSYIFSRPPAWLAMTLPGDSGNDDDLPDWPSDDADADVPEWLR